MQAQQEANEARQREQERVARIDTGRRLIDERMQGFDDGFFGQRRQNVLDVQMPELSRQFDEARRNLAFGLARAGLTRSTEAGRQQSLLQRRFEDTAGEVSRQAQQAEAEARRDVENQRQTLRAQLEASADPEAAANAATARSGALQQQVAAYSPLGDVFGGIATGIGQYMQGTQDRQLRSALASASATRGLPTSQVTR